MSYGDEVWPGRMCYDSYHLQEPIFGTIRTHESKTLNIGKTFKLEICSTIAIFLPLKITKCQIKSAQQKKNGRRERESRYVFAFSHKHQVNVQFVCCWLQYAIISVAAENSKIHLMLFPLFFNYTLRPCAYAFS